jgi:hypothetical protein
MPFSSASWTAWIDRCGAAPGGGAEARRYRRQPDLPRRHCWCAPRPAGTAARRGHHAQRAHDPRDVPCASQGEGLAGHARGARRDLHAPRRASRRSTSARGGRRENLRQPAQCRRRLPAAAGFTYHRPRPLSFCSLFGAGSARCRGLAGRTGRCCSASPTGGCRSASWRSAWTAWRPASPTTSACGAARRAAFRYRRHRLQGRRLRGRSASASSRARRAGRLPASFPPRRR